MLQSYVGTVDAGGLKSLRCESESDFIAGNSDRRKIWAVLDTEKLGSIHQAMMLGQRNAAFELLARNAVSIGSMAK